jgi:hypothetical protein
VAVVVVAAHRPSKSSAGCVASSLVPVHARHYASRENELVAVVLEPRAFRVSLLFVATIVRELVRAEGASFTKPICDSGR